MLLVAPHAAVLQLTGGHFSQPQRFVELAVGQQTRVRGDLTAQELQLQAAVKTDPQILVLAVTMVVDTCHMHFQERLDCGFQCGLQSWHGSLSYLFIQQTASVVRIVYPDHSIVGTIRK